MNVSPATKVDLNDTIIHSDQGSSYTSYDYRDYLLSGNNRYFHYEDNWLEIAQMIKENDLLAKTISSRVIYDDTDWNQGKVQNGLVDQNGNQLLGGEYWARTSDILLNRQAL